MKINEPMTPQVEPEASEPTTPVEGQTPVEPTPEAQPENDLMSRVAQFTTDNKPAENIEDNKNFDYKEIQNIEDPVAREQAEKAYKSMQRGFNDKFQEIADLRKAMEASSNTEWTPERVQALTQDPKFLAAAQQVTTQNPQGQSEEEYSALTDGEQAALNKVAALEAKLNQFENTQSTQQLQQEHDRLSRIYGDNYNQQAVDTIITDLRSGKVQGGPEAVWKFHDYEASNQRAYQMGLKDGNNGVQAKAQALSMDGGQVVQTPVNNVKADGVSSKQHFRNIASQVLADFKNKAAIKT
jgi:hypothetical protein